ncbi:MAG: hypothetical protein K9M94_11000, partial [Spirochaetia bacterium]|nr:hypothetical protein [Spirochaetia bacterium]
MKTQLISSLPALKAVWSSALVLIFVLSSTLALLVLLPGCNQSPAVSGQSGSNALHSTDALHTAVSAVLDLEFPEERYAGLLSLHLQYPRAFSPVIYLAQIESAAGRITAAEEWLQAARESATRESAAAGGG